jgi:hypothetical protein
MSPAFKINYTLIVVAIICCCISAAFAQVFPAPPQTDEVITCFPDTTGYKVITVGPVDRDYSDLQTAINEAELGTVLILDAGVSYYGGFQLPDKGNGDDWIILMSSHMELLPSNEMRIDPFASTSDLNFLQVRDAMPKLITNNLSGIPTIRTQAYAHHYRFVGLEITADLNVINSYGLINLGDGASSQNTLAVVPHHFVIDRCYIHGHTNATIMKYGIRLDCANAAIIDSYLADFHSIGFDAQAISGINGPGPFKILNNYLEASGENILIGGGVPAIPGLVPSDIEIRQNYFYKPFLWRVGHPEYAGKHWTIKNLFELKTGKRVLLDGNILENCWADLPTGQSGYAILLTVRTENGASPQADVSDIMISNNIVKHVAAGISLSGSDDGEGLRSSRIKISNNLFEDINGPVYGDQNVDGPNDGTFLKIGKPKDVWIDHNTILQSGPVTWAYDVTNNFIYTNNLAQSFISAGGYQGIYGPGQTQGNNTIARYFPDITDASLHFDKNVFIAGNPVNYTNYNTLSLNYFPADIQAAGFFDFDAGNTDYHNYRLSSTSPYKNAARDGSDLGVDFDLMDMAFTADRNCDIINSIDEENKNIFGLQLFPNPVHDVLYVNLSNPVFGNYSIVDPYGRIVMKGNLKSAAIINTSSLVPGTYVFQMVNGPRKESRLFIVY